MPLQRSYYGGSGEFAPTTSVIQANYTVTGTDGMAVTGHFDTNYLLTPAQLDELCNALQKACAGLPWVTATYVAATENGARTWSVTETTATQG